MKQYVHPILGRTITRHPRSFLGKEYYSVSSKLLDISVSISEEELLALWFIEKEEEPDTDTKWIDDVHSEYLEAIVSNSLYVWDDRFTDDDRLAVLKKAILSHIPKSSCK